MYECHCFTTAADEFRKVINFVVYDFPRYLSQSFSVWLERRRSFSLSSYHEKKYYLENYFFSCRLQPVFSSLSGDSPGTAYLEMQAQGMRVDESRCLLQVCPYPLLSRS